MTTMTDEMTPISSTPVETEPSSVYDPFETAAMLDRQAMGSEQEQVAEQTQQAPASQEAEQPVAEQPAEQHPAQGEAETQLPPQGYSPEMEQMQREIDYLRSEAQRARNYDQFFRTEDGKHAIKSVEEYRKQLAEKAQNSADAQKQSDEEWSEMSQTLFGDMGSQFNDALSKRMERMIDQRMKDKYGETLNETRIARAEREQRDASNLKANFFRLCTEKYGVPVDDAARLTELKFAELARQYPQYDRRAIVSELNAFVANEVAPIASHFSARDRQELEALRNEKKNWTAKVAAPSVPQTTTQVAATRLMGTSDADYKRNGSIPTGGSGSMNQAPVDEAAEALHYFGQF